MLKIKHIISLLIVSFFAILFSQPTNFIFDDFEIDEPTSVGIYAPKYLFYIDEEETEKAKKIALSKVENAYSENPDIYAKLNNELKTLKGLIIEYQLLVKKSETNLGEGEDESDEPEKVSPDNYFSTLDFTSTPLNLTKDSILLLSNMTQQDLTLYRLMQNKIKHIFNSHITVDNLSLAKNDFESYLSELQFSNQSYLTLFKEKIVPRIEPNLIFDKRETSIRRQEAVNSVKDVEVEYKKDEVIIRKGEIITKEHIELLSMLGLINDEGFDFSLFFKNSIYIIMIFSLLHIYVLKFYYSFFSKLKPYLFLLSSVFVIYLFNILLKDIWFSIFPVFVFLLYMMIYQIFWGRRFLLFMCVFIPLLVYQNDFLLTFLSVIAAITLSLLYQDRWKTKDINRYGLIIGLVLVFSYLIYSIVFLSPNVDEFLLNAFALFMFSFIVGVFTPGFVSNLENFLGIITPSGLYQLNDPEHALLKRLIEEAPGTYHHSLMVGNLAERAADVIGANSLLLRVGSYFHDVGKINNPYYFIENTRTYNPHDHIPAHKSAEIILQHPIDTINLCKEHDVPKAIIDLIASHHGDTTLHYFYEKAKQEELKTTINLEDFKYKTPIPKTKEEGILMLADSVEAYSKFLFEQGKLSEDELREKIEALIFNKIKENSLRESELTLKDLNKIKKVFVNILVSSNHSRTSYKND